MYHTGVGYILLSPRPARTNASTTGKVLSSIPTVTARTSVAKLPTRVRRGSTGGDIAHFSIASR